jgi:Sec-independent protein translocase protein TatA
MDMSSALIMNIAGSEWIIIILFGLILLFGNKFPKIMGPVATERKKLELIASSLGIENHTGLTDEELRTLISKKMSN